MQKYLHLSLKNLKEFCLKDVAWKTPLWPTLTSILTSKFIFFGGRTIEFQSDTPFVKYSEFLYFSFLTWLSIIRNQEFRLYSL